MNPPSGTLYGRRPEPIATRKIALYMAEHPGSNPAEVAAHVGIHREVARRLMTILRNAGYATSERAPHTSPGRGSTPAMYTLTAQGHAYADSLKETQ